MVSAIKNILKRLALGADPIPQFVTLNLQPPQQQIQITLQSEGQRRDVTHNGMIAALKPLTFAIGFPEDDDIGAFRRSGGRLLIAEQASQQKLGEICLKYTRTLAIPGVNVALFETKGYANYCLPAARLWLYSLFERRQRQQKRDPFNFEMVPLDQQCLNVFYICPRPVVLVTVVCGDRSNIFPMDLIGPVGETYFLMALRSTSPAVRLMKESRRIALSSMTLEHQETIYDLGKHHRLERIDWASLPFRTTASPLWGLPVPQQAQRVVEREILEAHVVGSHHLFVTTCMQDTHYTDGGQMAHILGFYADFNRRKRAKQN